MKKYLNVFFMELYVVFLLLGLIFSNAVLIHLSTATAVFTFLLIQNTKGDHPLEDLKKRSEKASNMSFQILLSLLIVASIGFDFIDVLNYVTLTELFTLFVGLGFMTFVSFYEYYQE